MYICISYSTAARGLPDTHNARGRVCIYQTNPEPGCVITFIFHFTRLTLQKDKGASSKQ